MSDWPDDDTVRLMRCPVCGHQCETRSIGAVYCGPHKTGDTYAPAVQMAEVTVAIEIKTGDST